MLEHKVNSTGKVAQYKWRGTGGWELGRIGGGRGTGGGRGKGGKRDSQGNGNQEKREKFCNIV